MNPKRFSAGLMFLVVLICPLVMAKESDGPILAKVGKISWEKSRDSLPNRAMIAAPLAAFRAGDALPVEERVRMRVEMDKKLEGIRIDVWPGDKPGQVRLRGTVPGSEWRTRIAAIAESTTGVESVMNELAVPEGK